MNPLVILLIGMAVVVGGILVFKLHAFLALAAGALVVALITPTSFVQRFALRDGAAAVVSSDGAVLVLRPKIAMPVGSTLIVVRAEGGAYKQVAMARVTGAVKGGVVPALVESGGPGFLMMPGDFVVDPATMAEAAKTGQLTIGERVAEGFGRAARDIGILIAMASILGKALIDSGAAERIVDSCRRALGESRVALAFMVSAFSLAGLVLADTTFYMLMPLAQAMGQRTGRNYTLYILAIVAGATMTHSLVPPAPGPVILATEFHVPLTTMILGGVIVGAISTLTGYGYALWANRRWVIPVRVGLVGQVAESEGKAVALPPLWLALIPIVVPVAMIAIRALAESGHWAVGADGMRILKTLGEKNVALSVGAALGLLLVVLRRRKLPETNKSQAVVAHGLASGGVMVLIISAGGAFGLVLRQTDIGATIRDMLPVSKLALVPLAFLVTTAIRTAQGSATVAIITAAGIVSPIVAAGELGFNPVYLATAIGCGSKPGMWMNDAGFWIIGRTSGFTEGETLKTASVLMALMGTAGLIASILGAWLLPLVPAVVH